MGVQTQWRAGLAGATGLDYAGVQADLRLTLGGQQMRAIWPGIKACERAVLEVWAEDRARREQERAQQPHNQPEG